MIHEIAKWFVSMKSIPVLNLEIVCIIFNYYTCDSEWLRIPKSPEWISQIMTQFQQCPPIIKFTHLAMLFTARCTQKALLTVKLNREQHKVHVYDQPCQSQEYGRFICQLSKLGFDNLIILRNCPGLIILVPPLESAITLILTAGSIN